VLLFQIHIHVCMGNDRGSMPLFNDPSYLLAWSIAG
jgi:hypothetical protein